jgi:phosphocarrier protein
MDLQTNVTRILEVKNKMGIHARPAAMIVRVANKYKDTEIMIGRKSETINAKSIMSIMMLAASIGTRLTFTAKGVNAQQVVEELTDLFNRKFEEGV